MSLADLSHRGRSARRKGYAAELAVAAYLRSHGWAHACTTRAVLGHGGTKQPGDISGFHDRVALEVKSVAASAWPTWLRQAQQQADGRIPAVVRKTAAMTVCGLWETRWVVGPDLFVSDLAGFCSWLKVTP